jgi:hypothetical protein
MTQEHPITPPPELVEQWDKDCESGNNPEVSNTFYVLQCFASKAARWGADQELEACINFLYDNELCDPNFYNDLRNHRRPKPPSLKEQALQALAHLENGAHCSMDTTESAHYIRRALESLPD